MNYSYNPNPLFMSGSGFCYNTIRIAMPTVFFERKNMMTAEGFALNWLRTVGKEKVQSFQDNFSEMFDISLCLVSLSGNPLTVWSSESLFCYYMQNHNPARCKLHRQQMLQKVNHSASTEIEVCYMGMTNFITPILLNDKPVAAFLGGAVDTGNCRVNVREDILIKTMTGQRLNEIGIFLHSITALLSPKNSLQSAENGSGKQQLINRFGLTPREFTVVSQIMTGKSNKEIAGTLYISEKTVKSHITSILRKMQAKDRKQVMLVCKRYF